MGPFTVPMVVRIIRSLLSRRRWRVDAQSFLKLPIYYLTIAARAMWVLNVTFKDIVLGTSRKGNTVLRNMDHLVRFPADGTHSLHNPLNSLCCCLPPDLTGGNNAEPDHGRTEPTWVLIGLSYSKRSSDNWRKPN